MAQEYRHVFLDQTSNQRLSQQTIQSGVGAVGESGAEITTGANVAIGAGNQLKEEITKKFINQPLNQMTGGLWNPARQTFRAIKSGGGAAMLAGGGTAVLFKGAEIAWQKHEERIAKLENEASEANNNDNALIMAGKLNVRSATISYNKYGRAIYKTDRS